MNKRILTFLLVIFATLCAVCALSACGSSSSDKGTYYLYENGSYDKESFITLNDSKWTDDEGESGEYKISGNSITLYVEFFGDKEEFATGTISDGVLTLNIMGADIVYCKDGKAPTGSTNSNGNSSSSVAKCTITYDANGGAFDSNQTTFTQSANSGATLTAPTSPTRTGSSFAGWATDKNGKTLWKFATDTVSGDITLYAVWEEQSAVIISIDGASIDEKKMSVFMLVDSDTDSVSLSNKIVCSSDSVWRLYYDKLGQTEIPTKIAAGKSGELSNGDNVFYIVVTSSNGSQVNVYELTVHRSYRVSVSYFSNKNALLKQELVYKDMGI
jgi:uncharacterized repeat protein (TIGR02543 family)